MKNIIAGLLALIFVFSYCPPALRQIGAAFNSQFVQGSILDPSKKYY